MSEVMELGSSIELVNFRDVERDKFVVVKKIVGNFVKRVQDRNFRFGKLSIHLRKIHNSEYELVGKLVLGDKVYHSEVVNYNLFYALNDVLRKLEAEVS